MSRLWSYGAELNSPTIESTGNNLAIQSTVSRSGTYAIQVTSFSSTVAECLSYQFSSAAGDGPFFFRLYFRADTLPSAENRIIMLNDANSFATPVVYLTIDNSGVLKLYDEDGQITGTTTLSTSTWYRIEIQVDRTPASGSEVVTARVDGADFATSSTRNLSAGVAFLFAGANLNSEAQTTGNFYYDDIAINDSTGSFQNSWPGEGEIIHLRPNAAGDNAGWVDGTGTTFAVVDEVTPNDATDYLESSNEGAIHDLNLDATPAALASDDTINCVQVGVRFRVNATASSGEQLVALRIKATSGGTVETSANLDITSTTWMTNKTAAPRNYHLTLYDLPGASTTAWTKTELDTAQIGVIHVFDDSTDEPDVSTLWLLVGHKPAAAAAGGGTEFQQTVIGSGFLPFYA